MKAKAQPEDIKLRDEKSKSDVNEEILKQIQVLKDQMKDMDTKNKIIIDELRSDLIKRIDYSHLAISAIGETNKLLSLAMKSQSEDILKLKDENSDILKQLKVLNDQMKHIKRKKNQNFSFSHQSDLEKFKEETKIKEQNLLAQIQNLTITNQSLLTTVKLHKQSSNSSEPIKSARNSTTE